MADLGALLFRMPRSSGPRWVVYENGQYVSLTRPPKKGTAFLFVDPGQPLQFQTPTGYVVEERRASGHEGLVEAKKFVDRAAAMLEGRDISPTGTEPTCPHSATQNVGGECEACYAKRTGWRPGQSAKEGTLSGTSLARASQLASAMNAARARTGDRTLAQEVNAGQFRVVRVTYDTRGKSTVVPLTSWSDAETHVQHLNALGLGERGSGYIERRHLIEHRRKVRLD